LLTLDLGRTRRIGETCGKSLVQLQVRNGTPVQQPEHFIQGDGPQPRLEARFPPELPEVAESQENRLLHDVFRFRLASQSLLGEAA
jgi:hypothetical protein